MSQLWAYAHERGAHFLCLLAGAVCSEEGADTDHFLVMMDVEVGLPARRLDTSANATANATDSVQALEQLLVKGLRRALGVGEERDPANYLREVRLLLSKHVVGGRTDKGTVRCTRVIYKGSNVVILCVVLVGDASQGLQLRHRPVLPQPATHNTFCFTQATAVQKGGCHRDLKGFRCPEVQGGLPARLASGSSQSEHTLYLPTAWHLS